MGCHINTDSPNIPAAPANPPHQLQQGAAAGGNQSSQTAATSDPAHLEYDLCARAKLYAVLVVEKGGDVLVQLALPAFFVAGCRHLELACHLWCSSWQGIGWPGGQVRGCWMAGLGQQSAPVGSAPAIKQHSTAAAPEVASLMRAMSGTTLRMTPRGVPPCGAPACMVGAAAQAPCCKSCRREAGHPPPAPRPQIHTSTNVHKQAGHTCTHKHECAWICWPFQAGMCAGTCAHAPLTPTNLCLRCAADMPSQT